MGTNKAPQGINYLPNANTVEYQLFPEEYFSGCDITIYFGDIAVSDISGMQFELQEKVNPIFGYASHTWDAVSRGNRYVSGYFKIPFKEAGYIETILSHIAESDDNSRPEIAYKMAGLEGPAWIADTKQTIEEYLKARTVGSKDIATTVPNTIFKNKTPIKPGDIGDHISEIRRLYTKAYTSKGWNNPFDEDGSTNEVIKFFNDNTCWSYDSMKEWAPTWSSYAYQPGATGAHKTNSYVLPIQHRLAQMSDGSTDSTDYWALNDSYWGPRTTRVAIQMCQAFGNEGTALRAAADEMQASANANSEGVSSVKPAALIMELASIHETEEDKKRYSADMYRTALWIKTQTGTSAGDNSSIKDKGVITETDLRYLYELAGESYDGTKTDTVKDVGAGINPEIRFAKYEQEVWGRSFSQDDKHQFQTFFYTDREQKDGTNTQEKLKKTGFDIYITYGPMPEAIVTNGYKLPDNFTFNTTVKSIKNIQLTSTSQVLNADGQPIEEIYGFIAQDID